MSVSKERTIVSGMECRQSTLLKVSIAKGFYGGCSGGWVQTRCSLEGLVLILSILVGNNIKALSAHLWGPRLLLGLLKSKSSPNFNSSFRQRTESSGSAVRYLLMSVFLLGRLKISYDVINTPKKFQAIGFILAKSKKRGLFWEPPRTLSLGQQSLLPWWGDF